MFALIEDLADPETEVDLERAKAITNAARTIVDIAKTEASYANALIKAGYRPQLGTPLLENPEKDD
jgi:hypothetical protein